MLKTSIARNELTSKSSGSPIYVPKVDVSLQQQTSQYARKSLSIN